MKITKISNQINENINPDFSVDPNSRAFDMENRNIISEITIYINKALRTKDAEFFKDLNELIAKYQNHGPKEVPSGANIIGNTGVVGTVEKFSNYKK